MALTPRAQAKLIAEELFKLLRKDVVAVAREVGEEEFEEYVDAKEAAKILGWKVRNVYARKDDIGAYTKLGRNLRFPKSKLLQIMGSGFLKSRKTDGWEEAIAKGAGKVRPLC